MALLVAVVLRFFPHKTVFALKTLAITADFDGENYNLYNLTQMLAQQSKNLKKENMVRITDHMATTKVTLSNQR